jgi:hypothetical protein
MSTTTEEEYLKKISKLQNEIISMHNECRKYRVALNRIMNPELWRIKPGFGAEIARRALIIGVKVDPLPDAVKLSNVEYVE